MRRGILRTAAFLSVLLLVGTSIPALGHQGTTVHKWHRDFDIGLSYQTSNHCTLLLQCIQYEKESIHTIDVSDEVASMALERDAHPDGYYFGELRAELFSDGPLNTLDEWGLCWYDGAGERIDCKRTHSGYLNAGAISWETETVRIIMYGNVMDSATLKLWLF